MKLIFNRAKFVKASSLKITGDHPELPISHKVHEFFYHRAATGRLLGGSAYFIFRELKAAGEPWPAFASAIGEAAAGADEMHELAARKSPEVLDVAAS
jgi:hypothetical protein